MRVLYKDKTAYTSKAIKQEVSPATTVLMNITGTAEVKLEHKGPDGVWRLLPESKFTGMSTAQAVLVPKGDFRVVITGAATTVELSA